MWHGERRARPLKKMTHRPYHLEANADTKQRLKAKWPRLGNVLGGKLCGLFWLSSCWAPSANAYDSDYHLSLADVSADHRLKPSLIHVRIKASKTDPFRRGTTVVLGKTGKDLCPITAIVGFLQTKGRSPDPFFRHQDGRPLTKPVFVK